jgi:hypothetical protein
MVNFEEYDKIIKECKEIAEEKNMLYGDESLKLFNGLGIFIRVFDKTSRLKNIYDIRVMNDKYDVGVINNNSETVEDTLIDLINYAIYLLMIERKKL